ncbi:beta-phosphoglucomutase family hydrolase [Thermodesulfovibrionales bacterium]|nr:beta-phosphoglucomutase family hydrolase [Thermodesulfovibrionales bacterium]
MRKDKNKEIKGAIFDLDGVVVDTVPIHFKAWKRMFAEYGKKFTFKDYKEKVDGIQRIDGGRAILNDLSNKELIKATDKKQEYFLENLKKEEIPVFKTTIKLMKDLRSRGIKIAVISSSKNSPYILNRTGIMKLIDAEVNGNDITRGKPHPQIFLMAAEKMGLKSKNCVVFEDAILGVEAAKRAKMLCVGIDRHNDTERLKEADIVVDDLKEINYDKLLSLFGRR